MTSLPTDKRKYMRIHSRFFQQDLKKLYNLHDMIDSDGYAYCEVMLMMYGLKQAAILAYTRIKERLGKEGYHPVEGTSGLWKHNTRPITFALCLNDFGDKYFNKTDVDHLLRTL